MDILYKANGQDNSIGSEYIYETNNLFVSIIMKTTGVYPPVGPIEPTNIIRYLNIHYKDDDYKMDYDNEYFYAISECYNVVYVGELSLRVGGELDF